MYRLSVTADDEGTHFETSASDLLKISNASVFEVSLLLRGPFFDLV